MNRPRSQRAGMKGALGAIRTHDPRIRNPVLYPPELRGRRTIAIAYQGGRIQRHGVCVRVRTSGPARKSESFLREPRSHVSHVGPRNRSVRRPSGDDSRGVPADHVYPPNQRLAAPGRGDMHARRRWYAGLRAGAAHGKATARFLQRKYEEATILFETADQLDPDAARVHFCHVSRGRCYRALGRYHEALEFLSRAYEPFVRDTPETEYAKREFVDFLEAFSDVLLRTGHVDRARHVAQRANDARRRRRIVG